VSGKAIAAIALLAVAGIVIIAGVAWLLLRRASRSR
jgi:nitrate reductase gamma subunit